MAILRKTHRLLDTRHGQKGVRLSYTLICLLLSVACYLPPAHAERIKEIANIEGVRENHLIGYGLVVGLDGTGDKSGTEFTIQSLVNMLNRFGIKVDPNDVKVKNVAAVVVTAELTPFKRPGSRIDVVVSSIGDAKSLQGGTLLFTPLRGADSKIYAVAQGPISIGGFGGSGAGGTSVQKNHLTVGRIPGGGLVEKEIPLRLNGHLSLVLRDIDFATSSRVAHKIDSVFKEDVAEPLDGMRIRLHIPSRYRGRVVDFISSVEAIDVPVDTTSRVVVNERTGTVVIGENVRISTVAISHGNLTVQVVTRHRISQPNPFGRGKTVVVPESNVRLEEEEARLIMVEKGVTLGDLVNALNALGVTPRDLISILQALKAAGALHARLELI